MQFCYLPKRYEALLETPEALDSENIERYRIIMLWAMALGTMIISSVGGAYWERAKLRFKLRSIGAVEAFFVCLMSLFTKSL